MLLEVGLFEIRIEEKNEISIISEQSKVIFTEQKMSGPFIIVKKLDKGAVIVRFRMAQRKSSIWIVVILLKDSL
jgi:hypothetical protein